MEKIHIRITIWITHSHMVNNTSIHSNYLVLEGILRLQYTSTQFFSVFDALFGYNWIDSVIRIF